MRLQRYFLLLLFAAFTTCGICSIFFPLVVRRKSSNSKESYYLWYYQEELQTLSAAHVYNRFYSYNFSCREFASFMTASACLTTIGSVVGIAVTLLASMHLCAVRKYGLCCTIMLLCLTALAAFVTALGLFVFVYVNQTCIHGAVQQALRDDDLALSTGFFTLAVATGGFFASLFLEVCS